MRAERKKFNLLAALLFVAFTLTLLPGRASGQDVTNSSNIGFPPNGIFDGSDFDNVQTANGNLHVHVPLLQLKGRGPTLSVDYHYDGVSYYLTERCTQNNCYGTWHFGGGGWSVTTSLSYILRSTPVNMSICGTQNSVMAYTGYVLTEPDNTQHQFVPDQNKVVQPGGIVCFSPIVNGLLYASDGSGWMIRVDPNSGNPAYNGWNYDLVRKDGTEIKSVGTTVTLTDPNGNQLIETNNGTTYTITDTLGRTISLPVTGPPSEIDYTDSNGTAQKILIATTGVSKATNFGCDGDLTCSQVTGSLAMPSLITLPNGLQYHFSYPTTTYPYGEVASATLPTGGQISWGWQMSYLDNTQVTSRTVTANGQNFVWSYTYGTPVGGVTPTTVTDPALNDTRYSCDYFVSSLADFANYGCQTFKVEYFSGSAGAGNVIKTITTDYDSTNTSLPIRETTTWAQTNQVTKVETDWDSFNTGQRTVTWRNPINKREYAFGTGTPGAIVRTTNYNYKHLTDSTYRNTNIADRPTSTIVYEANGTTVHAKTLYFYDNTTLAGTTGVVNHDYTHFSTSNTLRGNSTQIQRWRNTDGAMLTTNNYYNDVGNMIQTMDPATHNTYFDYTDSWYQSTCAPPSGTTQAFVTKTTNALSQFSTAKYDSCSSLVGSTTDLNSQTTTYSYDSMGRRTLTTFPDGGQVSVTYGATLPINNVTTTKITSSQNKVITAVLDDLGRVKQTQVSFSPGGPILADTTYDGFGRVATVSNPYQGTSTGTVTNQYDALGRTKQVTKQDGSIVTTAYCGSTTLVTDETGHWRRSTTDALGRLIEVDEPNSLTATVNSNGCRGTGEPIWVTSYSYDVVDNLLGVTQDGSRQRSFIYDSLSSLTSSTNPEAGTVLYTYDSEEKVQTKKDARNITITYAYESLHRMTGKTYSNGDPSAGYTYDQAGCLGQPSCYNIGRRTSMTDAGGSESVSYDKMGRVATHQRITNAISKNTSYTYNLDGSLLTLVYPIGRTITYAYDTAGRPVSALDTANGINYATAGTYAPQGALAGLTLGSTGSFTGIMLSNTYNTRLEPNEVKASSTAGTVFDLSYCFTPWDTVHNTCPATGNNNGNVTGITNNLDSNRTQFFGYDQVNRLLTAQTVSTFPISSAKCWGESFVYDVPGGGAWGNLIQINTVSTAYNGCTQENLSVGVNANNQITATGYSYDASGNFLTDSRNTYTWNAEGKTKSAASVSYTYDGDGNRVQKSNGKIYWYGGKSEILSESDTNGNITDEYVLFGGRRVAHRIVSGNSFYYYVEDLLGTTRVITTSTGTKCYDGDFYPFGGERTPYTNTCTQNYKFTGKERDAESGLDNFTARYDSSSIGRFMSPDPLPWLDWQRGNKEERGEFEDFISNPQNFNMYSYVNNNPLNKTDPTGMKGCQAGDKKFETCTITIVYDPKTSKGTITVTGQNKGDKDPTVLLTGSVVVGGDGHVTPTGTFTATTWEKDHVSTKYGSWANTKWSDSWMGKNVFGPFQLHIGELDKQGIMIHGTLGPAWSPTTWGNTVVGGTSHGCIRLCNQDDIALHNLMPNPRGNQIIIKTTGKPDEDDQ